MFNTQLWRSLIRYVSIDSYPVLPCPHCHRQALEMDEQTFMYRRLPVGAVSKRYLGKMLSVSELELKEAYEKNNFVGFLLGAGAFFEIIKYVPANFTCFLKCKSCHHHVSATGNAAIPVNPKNHEQPKIKIEYFSPTVSMFPLQKSTPESINDELLHAFNYYHSDLAASGARVRRAVEQFCAELGYSNGMLHNRIQQMTSAYPEETKWLQNLKLLGNEATHAGGIDETDLLNSFAIFVELLDVFQRRARRQAVQEASLQLEQKFKKA